MPSRRRTTSLELERRGATREVVPVTCLEASPGPTVAITANVHGDEATGLAAVLQLQSHLEAHLAAGTVVLYPSLNPQGLRLQQRPVPADGVDPARGLQRFFLPDVLTANIDVAGMRVHREAGDQAAFD